MSKRFRSFYWFSLLTALALVMASCAQATPAAAPTAEVTQAPVATEAPTEAMTVAPAQPLTTTSVMTATEAIAVAPASTMTTTGALPATGSAFPLKISMVGSLGNVVVDANGMTLYVFQKDTPGVSTCTGNCATNWPALTVTQGVTPTVTSDITATVGTITRPDGTIQVTLNNQPLYHFAKDAQPGDAKGQGIGSVWFVVGADGKANQAAGGAAPAAATATP